MLLERFRPKTGEEGMVDSRKQRVALHETMRVNLSEYEGECEVASLLERWKGRRSHFLSDRVRVE